VSVTVSRSVHDTGHRAQRSAHTARDARVTRHASKGPIKKRSTPPCSEIRVDEQRAAADDAEDNDDDDDDSRRRLCVIWTCH
jgi:hypothetical protein